MTAPQVTPHVASQVAPQVAPEIITEIDALMAAFHAEGSTRDLAYGLIHDGQVIGRGLVGAVGDDDPSMSSRPVYRIASMTKSFTAAAALLLRDEARLCLDDPVSTYIPGIAALQLPTADAAPLTTRMLLTMSAGLPTDDPWADRQESMTPDEFDALVAQGFHFSTDPGIRFEYSNLGYALVGRVVANVSGQPYHEFVRERLIDPMGLNSTRFDSTEIEPALLMTGFARFGGAWEALPFDRPGSFSAIGGLYSSVDDLARWIGGFTEAFPPSDAASSDHPLQASSRREMQQLHRYVGVKLIPGEGLESTAARVHGYGFGLNVEHDTRWGQIIGHSGGYPGFGTHMRWHPATGYGVVVLGNGTYTPAGRVGAAALDVLLGAAPSTAVAVVPSRQTLAMQAEVHQLILDWDDVVADRIFSANMDLDLSRERRRAAVAEVLAQLGQPADGGPMSSRSVSGAHIHWSIPGHNGRLDVQIWLTPEASPLVHTVAVTFVASGS